MTPLQWMRAAVGRLDERGETSLARQLADAERCAAELLAAAREVAPYAVNTRTPRDRLQRAIAAMERVKG